MPFASGGAVSSSAPAPTGDLDPSVEELSLSEASLSLPPRRSQPSGSAARSAGSVRGKVSFAFSGEGTVLDISEADRQFSHEDASYDVDGLINNDAVQALSVKESRGLDIQRCLEELGVLEPLAGPGSATASAAVHADFSPPRVGSMPTPLPAVFQSAISLQSPAGSEIFQPTLTPPACALTQREEEERLMRRLFGRVAGAYSLREQHTMLGGVLRHIFCQEHSMMETSSSVRPSNTYSSSTASVGRVFCSSCAPCFESEAFVSLRRAARRVTCTSLFSSFFLMLTLYSLFSNDIIVLYISPDMDYTFLVINTLVFLLFVVELFLVMLAKRSYAWTVPFFLDMVSLVSIFNDTWFIRSGGLFGDNEEASRLSRMARTSKMTRLARIARVARVTKLIPKLLSFFRRQHSHLAKKLIMRRLWRSYLYLCGGGSIRWLSAFDVKIFYITILWECRYLQSHSKHELLAADVEFLCHSLDAEDQDAPMYDFDEFVAVILGTGLGADMVRFHESDVGQETGVWTLTQKLSDTTALKVCVGILILVCMISLLEVVVQDRSTEQTLTQLTYVAGLRLDSGAGLSQQVFCEHLLLFAAKMSKAFEHKVLLMRIAGWTLYDHTLGGCMAPLEETAAETLARKAALQSLSQLRDEEVLWECIPSGCKDEPLLSAILIDSSAEVRHQSMMALLTIVMAILLLLIFVYILNLKINMFSGNLLSPLRSLVDDMTAMSCLELVHIDEDMPAEKSKPIQVAEELEHLQSAFKAMRSAIRSWSRYVPSCVVEALYTSGTEATIGVVKCNATILFVDIGGFQDICVGLPPNDVLKLLENVFNIIGMIIHKQRGTLLEFIADEVLAVFNTPRAMRHHSLAGLTSAQQIHQEINSRSMLVKEDGTEVFVRCRVGVHTSKIFAGNIGSTKRMKYGLLGDGINQTARIKGLTSRYMVGSLCTQQALVVDNGLAAKRLCTRPVDRVAVKGKQHPTTVYEVLPPNQGREWQVEAAKCHLQGFKMYQDRKFEAARKLFNEVQSSFANHGESDYPSRLMLSRCNWYIENPPGHDWDGVDRLKSKSFAPPTALEQPQGCAGLGGAVVKEAVMAPPPPSSAKTSTILLSSGDGGGNRGGQGDPSLCGIASSCNFCSESVVVTLDGDPDPSDVPT